MKKKIWVPLCLAGVLLAAGVAGWLLSMEGFALDDIHHSFDVAIAVEGNAYQPSAIEAELYKTIEDLEVEIENVTFRDAAYELDADGAGKACFSFRFDRKDTAYTRLVERFTAQQQAGLLELWVSLPDATLYYVSYNYGDIQGVS